MKMKESQETQHTKAETYERRFGTDVGTRITQLQKKLLTLSSVRKEGMNFCLIVYR